MIWIIIPVFNRWKFTLECLQSLLTQDCKKYKIVVVDHGSTDGTSQNIKSLFPDIILLNGSESMWWASATNFGVKYALNNDAKYILTLNNDLIVDHEYIKNLLAIAKENPDSIIGSISVNIKDKEHILFAGTRWNKWMAKYSLPVSLNLSYSEFSKKYLLIDSDLLPGRGTLIPDCVFTNIGFFDEKRFPHYMADEDFSDRAKRAGFNLYVSTKAVIYSHLNETGLNTIVNKANKLSSLKQILTSIKSPNNIFVRWNWSKKSKFPILYFIIDFGRVVMSQLLKLSKQSNE